jgi:DtxR family Mn-dependent transcriptional regulator
VGDLLVERLSFKWNEVHEVAEQLEHIHSEKLTDKLAEYLGDPAFDPHGDPIPDRNGTHADARHAALRSRGPLRGHDVRIAAVRDSTDALLHLLDRKGIAIGKVCTLHGRHDFDHSLDLVDEQGTHLTISAQAASHLWVETVGASKRKEA